MAVVGAGVSGCAAALALAEEGVRVVLVSSALDTLGLPGYGPAVDLGEGAAPGPADFGEVMRNVAAGLADAWLEHAWQTAGGPRVGLVDRRAVSLAVKWHVENHRLIEIRQGIVTAIDERAGSGNGNAGHGVAALTAFGERIEADAAVVAVGLALGGRTHVDGRVSGGGRLGEVGADALLEHLRSRGVSFETVRVAVGARVRTRPDAPRGGPAPAGDPGRRPARPADPGVPGVHRVELAPVALDRVTPHSPAGGVFVPPPSPYDHARVAVAALAETVAARVAVGAERGLEWGSGLGTEGDGPGGSVRTSESGGLLLMPDGLATGEWYVAPEVDDHLPLERVLGRGTYVSRPAHVVSGHVASGGQGLMLPGVWVTGQAAGARGYVESLTGGRLVGGAVAADLLKGPA